MATLSLALLGPVLATMDKQPLTRFRSKIAQALLIYLACQPTQTHRREHLMTILWPGLPQRSAQASLRQNLYLLRKAIPELPARNGQGSVVFLLADRQTVQINPEGTYELDLLAFDKLLKKGPEYWSEAMTLYRGDFLADFYLPDSAPFEAWVLARRADLRRQSLEVLDKMSSQAFEQGDYRSAERYARQQLTVDNLRESAHQQLINILAQTGRRPEALSHFHTIKSLLQHELGVEPSAEISALYARIQSGEIGKRAMPAPAIDERETSANVEGINSAKLPAADTSVPTHNLPLQATPFIGREAELARLDELLANPDLRLITITGPGGMGKTRLALAVAEQLAQAAKMDARPAVADGVFFVNLAPLSDVEQIVAEIAEVLNIHLQEGDGRSLRQQLYDFLATQKLLLVLDNFEHLLTGTTLLSEMLQSAPQVQLLVTSRERLHLQAEQLYPIEGLAFPDWETVSPVGEEAEAAEYTAVKLFLQSARRNQPDFELRDGDDLTYLARICRTVAGMPLALELAASWIDMLPLAEIAAELRQGLDFLETDKRDMPERHRSIRAAIDYSWRKLDEEERTVFAKLSVFRGGFTREAAGAIAGATLRHLSRLVSKSLLQVGQADDRYQIHTLLRQYGAEKLVRRGEETAALHQHCDFFCQAMQRWEKRLNSSGFRAAVTEIEADYKNIELAWEYALAGAQWQNLLIAVNGLGDYFDAQGRWFTGIRLFQQSAKRLQPDTPTASLTLAAARILVWLAAWQAHLDINAQGWPIGPQKMYQRLMKPALRLLEQPLFEDVDSLAEEAFLHLQVGRILKHIDSRWQEGERHLDTSLRLYREVGNLPGMVDAFYESNYYNFFGLFIHEKILVENTQMQLQECLDLLQPLDEPRRLIRLYLRLSALARDKKAFAEATAMLENAYYTAKSIEHPIGMWDIRHHALRWAIIDGQFDLALGYSYELLTLAEQASSPVRVAISLSLIGIAQVYRGEFLQALAQFQETRRYQKERVINPDSEIGWLEQGFPLAYLHAGHYDRILALAKTHPEVFTWQDVLIFVYLAKAEYQTALSLAQKLLAPLPQNNHMRGHVLIPMAAALFGLGRQAEARQALYQSLQISLEIRHLVRTIRLMPIIALLLANTENLSQLEYAIELWALAGKIPFVNQSQLYADVVGQPMAAVIATMSEDVVAAAQARGSASEWWPTAEALLTQLTEMGWHVVS